MDKSKVRTRCCAGRCGGGCGLRLSLTTGGVCGGWLYRSRPCGVRRSSWRRCNSRTRQAITPRWSGFEPCWSPTSDRAAVAGVPCAFVLLQEQRWGGAMNKKRWWNVPNSGHVDWCRVAAPRLQTSVGTDGSARHAEGTRGWQSLEPPPHDPTAVHGQVACTMRHVRPTRGLTHDAGERAGQRAATLHPTDTATATTRCFDTPLRRQSIRLATVGGATHAPWGTPLTSPAGSSSGRRPCGSRCWPPASRRCPQTPGGARS